MYYGDVKDHEKIGMGMSRELEGRGSGCHSTEAAKEHVKILGKVEEKG